MYTCIPKLKLGDHFFFDTPQLHILYICVCPSYVQVVPSNFKQKMYHVMVQRTITSFFIIAASMIAKTRITTEEEAKAALAERRRLAREQAEREAELEKLRLVRTCSLLLFQNLS